MSVNVPSMGRCRWPDDIEVLPPGIQNNTANSLLEGRMTFLNSTQEIGWMPDWKSEQLPMLWRFNLHYFEWLWALEYQDAKKVVLDWIENHHSAKGQEGWLAYPMSLRLMNLCGVFCAKHRSAFKADESFKSRLWQSIYCQTECLMGHLETHLMGNHYFENGAALAFVGSCFEGPDAQRWLVKGTRIMDSEVLEQVLSCGLHFELSPMYHSRILYLLGILSATGDKTLKGIVDEPIRRMMQALSSMCHPDGQISLFKDSAIGIYNDPKQLLEYCSRVSANSLERSVGAFDLESSGYYGWKSDSGAYLVCDFGKVGADYQPAHAHAGMLGYELSLSGHRVIVDSGVQDYGPSEWRKYSRSTAAHNTVEIDEQDQCELWGNFRVARRGYPQDVKYRSNKDGFKLSGSHSGYERLPGKPRHSREIKWDWTQDLMSVRDTVSAMDSVKAVSRIHLHPDCFVREHKEESLIIGYPKGEFRIDVRGSNVITIGTGWYFPEFGKKIQNTVIEIRSEGVKIESGYDVQSLKPS